MPLRGYGSEPGSGLREDGMEIRIVEREGIEATIDGLTPHLLSGDRTLVRENFKG
jgi:hypothetical protein